MGVRVILGDSTDLEDDSKNEIYSKFWQWHKDHGVGLRYLSPTRANAIISNHNIDPTECTQGIGIWGDEFAILFGSWDKPDPNSAQPRRIPLRIITRNDSRFDTVESVCRQIIEESTVMESDATPKIMAPKMVSMWRDYVIPEKRWGRIRPFLYHFFDVYRREEKRIIDIAAGMGVEYYEMLHDGFDISANEVQDELRECGERYRRDMGFRTAYYPYRYSWLKLDESGETGKFYGLFALGNSLRMMSSSNVQQETLAKFGDMLRSGGTVMVDERNYGVIKNNAEKINELGNDRNSSRLFKDVHDLIHGAENPMYHGSNIGSIPYRVDSDNRVSFLFYDNREDIYTLRQAENHRIQDWVFLHDARMETMLEHAGFVDIQKYADYCLDKRLEQDMEEAAMHVFVAKKP